MRCDVLLVSLVLLASCKPKVSAAPEPDARSSAPSASATPTPVVASAAARVPDEPADPWNSPDLSPAVAKRVESWRWRAIKRKFRGFPSEPPGFPPQIEMVAIKNLHVGGFDVIHGDVATPVIAGGASDTQEELIVTKAGELELMSGPDVIGVADLNGDGRDDLVLKDVTMIADMPNGPLNMPISAKGGAYGWREAKIGTYEGKPAVLATTQTDTEKEVGVLRAGGYIAQYSKGIREEVTLQWNGKSFAAVARKPDETAEDAAAREKKYADERHEEEERVATNKRACVTECQTRECDGGSSCAKRCEKSCSSLY